MVIEIVRTSGVKGTARSPATDGLFETREDAAAVAEPVKVWYHKVVAMILYLAKLLQREGERGTHRCQARDGLEGR